MKFDANVSTRDTYRSARPRRCSLYKIVKTPLRRCPYGRTIIMLCSCDRHAADRIDYGGNDNLNIIMPLLFLLATNDAVEGLAVLWRRPDCKHGTPYKPQTCRSERYLGPGG